MDFEKQSAIFWPESVDAKNLSKLLETQKIK